MTDKMTYGAEMEESKPMGTEEVLETRENEAEAIELAQTAEPTESMDDYAAELEASFKKVREGDILTGTVIGVFESHVLLDLKYYAEGIIEKENLSNDPDFNMKEEIHVGDEITATVLKTDDGEGNIVLSMKKANDKMAWDRLRTMLEERTVVPVKITEIVNSGAIAQIEGMRGFIPASRLDAAYVENLEDFLGRTIDVTVITADEEHNKLVLSGREAAREKLQDGTVDSIKPYGAFISLENGLSGLVHISQISSKRIPHPSAVLKEGQKVTVKIISTADNKISLSMKAVEANEAPEEEVFNYHESGEATTGLGELFKNLKL